MTWSRARAELRTLLETLGHPVYAVAPADLDAAVPVIMLVPPARDVERRASGVRRTVYHQRVIVMQRVNPDRATVLEEVANSVDGVVEAINDALDGALSLGGDSVVVSPPSWEELTVADYPINSGLEYATMDCTIDIEVERLGTFLA